MTPEARALLLVIEAMRAMLKAKYQSVNWPGATAERAMEKLDEAADLLKPEGGRP